MYAGVCAFKDGVQELFKCDTVDATCEDGNVGSCGGGGFDSACFSHVSGVIWHCFLEIMDNPSVGVLVMKTKILTTSCWRP